jgi:hypothetical protein
LIAEIFDDITRTAAVGVPRRSVLKLFALAATSSVLMKVGIRPAWAVTTCRCGGAPLGTGQACCRVGGAGTPYDTAVQCCTPVGVQPKHPIVDLAACPNRVPHPGHVPTSNGCGGAGFPLPPVVPFVQLFTPCCDTHDFCYGTCNSDKGTCDSNFLSCMQNRCVNTYLFTFPPNLTQLSSCLAASYAFYGAVSLAGGSFYDNAQKDACDCCAGDAPCCPAGQVMCGDLCCDPGQTCSSGQCVSCSGDWTCGQAHNVCGSGPPFPGGSSPTVCISDRTVEGTCFCWNDFLCAGATTCASSADCPPGYGCVTSCCGQTCAPPCGSPALVARSTSVNSSPAELGRSASGVLQ